MEMKKEYSGVVGSNIGQKIQIQLDTGKLLFFVLADGTVHPEDRCVSARRSGDAACLKTVRKYA